MFSPAFSDHALAPDIDRVRHHTFMKLALPHLVVGLLTAVLLFLLFEDHAIESAGVIWFSANLLLLVCTLVFYSLYYLKGDCLSIAQWGRVTFLVALLWGVCWSLPPFILLGDENVLYIGLLVTFVVSMSAVPAPVLVHYPGAYFVFITLPLAALTLKTSMISIENQAIIQLLPPFLWLSLLVYGWDLHKTVIESIRLRLENEQALGEVQQASLAKSRFIAAASHDIRQPLQAAVLSLDAIRSREGQNLDQLLPNLEKSVDSIADLITGLLDISRLDSGTVQVCPEHLALSGVLARLKARNILQAEEKGLELAVRPSPHSGRETAIFCDPVLLDRVLNNLVNNAIRYTDQGSVTVAVSLEYVGNQADEPGEILIQIRDTGVGIAPEQWSSIFEEFYQVECTKRDHKIGLGLGLSIVKRLCDLQDWALDLTSVPGQGSCFSIRVPLGNLASVKAKMPQGTVGLNGLSVLVIDDHETVRDMLSDRLSAWQCDVRVAEDTPQAIDQLDQGNWLPDLVISDYRLGDNQSGIEAIDQLTLQVQAHADKAPVTLLMTGDTAPDQLCQLAGSGITVLHKPIKPGHLRAFIQRQCLSERG